MLIGQIRLQQRIIHAVERNKFPRFSIIVGPTGCGKKTIAGFIVRELQKQDYVNAYWCPDTKVDTIREITKNAYKVTSTTVYIIPDADSMSGAARNALLKVTEEPPNKAYFIMTLEDENYTLATIRSRGTIFKVYPYKPEEIAQYLECRYTDAFDSGMGVIIAEVCSTPGEVDMFVRMGAEAFYKYVRLVVDNIADVSVANAFKIPSKVALKEGSDAPYDLKLFWKTFQRICLEIVLASEHSKASKYAKAILVTDEYIQKLQIRSINKQALMDIWILDVRHALEAEIE